jgi:CO dehydrogenase maturation factor
MGELPAQQPRDVTVLDMEASIEHLTRGTVRNVDVLLLVTEPYYRSLETMGRIAPLAQELGVPLILGVANKVRSEQDEAAIREFAARRGVELIAVVPYDENVVEADREGRALIDYALMAPAVLAVNALADALQDRCGEPAARACRGPEVAP